MILDEKGDDLYRANGPIPYLNTGRFEAFSQGVGIGDWRPYTGPYDTGGIGVICDLAGSDRYEVGAYGQGFSMFMGLGILYDRAGNDLYSGDRFPQASAAHSGIGILADDSGDDTYWAIGDANQSGGGDHVLTLLIDRSAMTAIRPCQAGLKERRTVRVSPYWWTWTEMTDTSQCHTSASPLAKASPCEALPTIASASAFRFRCSWMPGEPRTSIRGCQGGEME